MAGHKPVDGLPALVDPRMLDGRNGKPKRISKKMREAVSLILTGEVTTMKAAAERIGLAPKYLRRALRLPHVGAYVETRTRETLSEGKLLATSRLISLIHAKSEHVSLDASVTTLGINGITPPERGGTNINLQINNGISAGYVIDLTPWQPIGHERSSAETEAIQHDQSAGVHPAIAMRPGMSPPRIIEHDHATGQRVDKGPLDPNDIRPVGRSSHDQ